LRTEERNSSRHALSPNTVSGVEKCQGLNTHRFDGSGFQPLNHQIPGGLRIYSQAVAKNLVDLNAAGGRRWNYGKIDPAGRTR
jgi:hypothetical protein